MGHSFWPCYMHEPLIVLIFLRMAHVSNYRRSPSALVVQNQLEYGFKHPGLHGCREFHDLEGPMNGLQDLKEKWIWSFLFKLIEAQENFPPRVMRFGTDNATILTRRILFMYNKPIRRRRRKRRSGDGGMAQQALPYSKRRRTLDETPFE